MGRVEPVVKTKLDAAGRVSIPAEFRRALNLQPNEVIVLVLDEEEGYIRMTTPLAALHRLRKELKRIVPPGVSLVDELIAERRAEAARE